MDIVELGVLDGPMLVFGGPYSNLQALRALRVEAERRNIPPDHCLCTGDVVAYCANPAETVAEIRDWGCVVVAGNCERQLGSGAENCGCGFEAGTTCDLLSAGWYAYADAQIEQHTRAWMAGLPDGVRFTHRGLNCVVIHGGITDISRFLWPVSPEADLAGEIAHLPEQPDMILAGHSGVPFQRQVGQTRWVNAGVIGMPPHDGDPHTRFAILKHGQVEILPLAYDWSTAQHAMEQAGLTQGYHLSLQSGWWPSEDVLPQSLRRSASVANG